MNKVCLIGRLTSNPEIRYTQTNNTLVATITLAINRGFQNEEKKVDFIKVIAWSKIGEFVSKYLKKGQQIGITGRIQSRSWQDNTGTKRYTTEVIAEEVYFADKKITKII